MYYGSAWHDSRSIRLLCLTECSQKTPLYMLGDGTTIQNIFINLNFESWNHRSSFQVLFRYLETIWSFVQSRYHKHEGKSVNVTITQSSSTSFFLVDSMRWWPVMQSVPSTGFWNGPCITTPSSFGIGINSANSIAGFNPNWSVALAPENKQRPQVFQWECQVTSNSAMEIER